MDAKPPRALKTIWPVLAATGLLLTAEVALWLVLSRQPLGLAAFWLALVGGLGLILLGGLGWWWWGYWSLRYVLNRNALVIHWAGLRQVISLEAIEGVDVHPQPPAAGGLRMAATWLRRMLGYWVGPARTSLGTPVQSYATRPLAEQLLIRTKQGTWGISPVDPEAFLQRLEAERRLGPTRQLALACHWIGPLDWPILRDRWALALWGIGSLGSLAFFGLTAARGSRFTPGGPMAAPAIALAFLVGCAILGGLVHRHDRLTARLLWAGAAWVQWAAAVIVWIAK
jgi:hypothetical protein